MTDSLTPQELADRAKQIYQTGDYPASAKAYSEAAAAYAEAGDPLMSAEMKNNQSVAFLLAGQPQAALEAAAGTEKLFVASKDFRREGIAFANQASALDALKRRKEAIECYHQAAEALEKAGEWDLRVSVMQLLAVHYLRRLKLYDAVITLQSGLAGVKNPTPKQRFMKKILFVRL